MAGQTIEEVAHAHDLTNRRVLDLAKKLGIAASRPGDRLYPDDVDTILSSIGYRADEATGDVRSESEAATPYGPKSLASVRIRSYRSITDLTFDVSDSPLTFVGPNNSGKTNILRAIELAFAAAGSRSTYDRARDLSFSATDQQRTGIWLTFTVPRSSPAARAYQRFVDAAGLTLRVEEAKPSRSRIVLRVEFSTRGVPTVRVRPLAGIDSTSEAQVSEEDVDALEVKVIDELLEGFRVRYIPSVKNVNDLYRDLVLPEFVRTVARSLAPQVDAVTEELDSISGHISRVLGDIGLEGISARLVLPDDSLERLIERGFDLRVSDPNETSIFEKGHGIQTTVLLSTLLWITEDDARRGKTSVWLLEEPESYLHPELSGHCKTVLEMLADRCPVLVTTHSLSFVPSDHEKVLGVARGDSGSTVRRFQSHKGATEHIRRALGVRFADYLSVGARAVFLEGTSDVRWIEWIRSEFPERWPLLQNATLSPGGSAQHLRSFASWAAELLGEEGSFVLVFDGDREGIECWRGLKSLSFFKAHERANYAVVVGKDSSIEDLVPDKWKRELHRDDPDMFRDFEIDSQGVVIEMRVAERRKHDYMIGIQAMAGRASTNDWADRYVLLCESIEKCLVAQERSQSPV